MKIGSFETDAEVAAVIESDAAPKDAMFYRGTFLKYGQSDWKAPGEFAAVKTPDIQKTPANDSFMIGDKVLPGERFTVSYPLGRKIYGIHGFITNPEVALFELPQEKGRHFIFSGQHSRSSNASGPEQLVAIPAGDLLYCVSSGREFERITLAGLDVHFDWLSPLPREWRPPADAISVEAEQPVAETGPAMRVEERGTSSGGKISAGWEQRGKSASWEFMVPQSGMYRVVVNLFSANAGIIREMSIDDKGFATFSLDQTGVSGASDWVWRNFMMPQPIFLAQGTHRISLKTLRGEAKIDRFILYPVNPAK